MMKTVFRLTMLVLAASSGACGGNELMHAPKPPAEDLPRFRRTRAVTTFTHSIRRSPTTSRRSTSGSNATRRSIPRASRTTSWSSRRRRQRRHLRRQGVRARCGGGQGRPFDHRLLCQVVSQARGRVRAIPGLPPPLRLGSARHTFAERRDPARARHDVLRAAPTVDFSTAFEAAHCSLKPFKKGLKAASAIVSPTFGQGQLPAMMHLIDQRDHWVGRLQHLSWGP